MNADHIPNAVSVDEFFQTIEALLASARGAHGG
jgi:hypothetical protein